MVIPIHFPALQGSIVAIQGPGQGQGQLLEFGQRSGVRWNLGSKVQMSILEDKLLSVAL